MGKIKIKGTISFTQFVWLTLALVGGILVTGVLYVIILKELGIV